ncbi:MAG: hypothetical protein HY761_09940 [Candidatus Omnitrophica bacterium]|nr:hypothetical protein [Candidatus Omnitrophota bacterium]
MRQKIIKQLRKEIRKDLAKEQDRFEEYLWGLNFLTRVKILIKMMIRPRSEK